MAIRAIKTTYKGVLFMSTLEADWAKTLDAMRIAWQYEPEGVKLPDGQNYRCDFYLPRLSTWLEVKGPHNQRLDKPGTLADAVLHADGCDLGQPVEMLTRPAGMAPARCPCGFGPDFPCQAVVVGRPATNGKLTYEPPHARSAKDALLVVLDCPTCKQRSFIDHHGLPVCRRCRQDATGAKAWRSGSLPFHRVEPPRGRPARRRSRAA